MREEIFQLVNEERERQDKKWGTPRNLSDYTWSCVLLEEVGEVARAVLERDWDNLKVELIQVIAVCIAWLEDFEYRLKFYRSV